MHVAHKQSNRNNQTNKTVDVARKCDNVQGVFLHCASPKKYGKPT